MKKKLYLCAQIDSIMRKSTIIFLLSVVVSLFMTSMNAYGQLPSVQLKDINGKVVNTQKLVDGKGPVVLSFWATYCKPCIRELKAIHEVYADWQEETGVRVIIVSVDAAQDQQKVKPMVDGYGWEYDCLLDPNGDFKRQMGVNNVPHLFILDKKGKIVYNHPGYTDGGEEEIYEVISKLKD